MPRDDNIGADTSGRSGDIGGSRSGGKAGNDPMHAFGDDVRDGENPISKDEAREADSDQLHGTPDDLKLGKRRTVGMDEDSGAGERDVSGVPDSTTGGG